MLHLCRIIRKERRRGPGLPGQLQRLPPQAFFGVSAIFHYLGPSLAVLLLGLGVVLQDIAGITLVILGVALHRTTPHRVNNEGA